MEHKTRTNYASGVLLILIGAAILAFKFFPALAGLIHLDTSWPVGIMTVGVGLFILGLVVGAPGMAVPACIVGGIGGILYYQNLTGDWQSWSYAWALIPGFVGVGVIIAGLIGGGFRKALLDGGWSILVSLVLFAIFASMFGKLPALGAYWPVLLILMGFLVLAKTIFLRRSQE
jgi:hypothetical protein